jgi:U3 small nucleolar RNA-associated protein 11
MAPLRHDVAKKQHRERAQPLERRKYGLLEKKKDYKLRSADFHRKDAQLKLLRKKATERNPDEFSHGMINSRTDKNGVLISDRGNQVLSVDAAKLLKTQDSGYVRTLASRERQQIDKLESGLLFSAEGNHTVFVDDERSAKEFDPAKHFDTDASLVNRRENRLRVSQLERSELSESKVDDRKRASKFKELGRRLDRQTELVKVQQEMDLQRELMKKGDKKKVEKDGKVFYKWKAVRKK